MTENALMKFMVACMSGAIGGLWWAVDEPLLSFAWFLIAAIWVFTGINVVRHDRLVKRQRQEWGIDR